MKQSTLQVEILKRFMSAGEYETLMESYKSNSKSKGVGGSRKENALKKITAKEIEMLKRSISEMDTPLSKIAKDYGVNTSTFHSRVERTAYRWILQNIDVDEI